MRTVVTYSQTTSANDSKSVSAPLEWVFKRTIIEGLNLRFSSIKFTQCQTVCHTDLRHSHSNHLIPFRNNTTHGMSLLCNIYRDTNEVITAVRSKTENAWLNIDRIKVLFTHFYFCTLLKSSPLSALMRRVNCLRIFQLYSKAYLKVSPH